MSNSIAQQLSWAKAVLANEGAALDAEVILAYVLGKNRSYLYAWPETELDEEQQQSFRLLIQQCREGKPVAYIVGTQEFWSMPLKVTADTLIPRPETEQMVDAVLQYSQQKNDLWVLDAGTGTGAIALALAKENPFWQVFACDFSQAALAVARENAKTHHHNIHYFCADWLSSVQADVFDIIVSNPPYIAENDLHLAALGYEPTSALVSRNQGLADINILVSQARQLLKQHGALYIEHGYDQAVAVKKCFLDHGFIQVNTEKDYAGCDRFTHGVKG